jgi:hypothetical protein
MNDLDGKLKRGSYERIQGTSTEHNNLNNYKTAGFYNVKTAYVDNVPTGIGIDAVLLVYPWDSTGYETQEITEAAGSPLVRRWIRRNYNGDWSDWKTIFSTDNIDTYLSNKCYIQGEELYGVPELSSPDGD